jgi:hypothetical protein
VTDRDPSGPGLARDLVAAHHGDRVSVLATAEATLARIADVEPDLRAFAHLDPAAVLERARELDAVPPSARGPLHGLPVGLKDIIDTDDAPTAYGSPIHAGHRPERDAIVVGRRRAAGRPRRQLCSEPTGGVCGGGCGRVAWPCAPCEADAPTSSCSDTCGSGWPV